MLMDVYLMCSNVSNGELKWTDYQSEPKLTDASCFLFVNETS